MSFWAGRPTYPYYFSPEKVFLEIQKNSQENTCARASFSINVQALGLQLYWKRDSGTGVSSEFCKISKSTFSCRAIAMAASVLVQIIFNLLQNDLLHRVSFQVFATVFWTHSVGHLVVASTLFNSNGIKHVRFCRIRFLQIFKIIQVICCNCWRSFKNAEWDVNDTFF